MLASNESVKEQFEEKYSRDDPEIAEADDLPTTTPEC